MSSKRLTRSRQHNIIAGVMGGDCRLFGLESIQSPLVIHHRLKCQCRCTGNFSVSDFVVFNANGRRVND
jgi:hypothetical protein